MGFAGETPDQKSGLELGFHFFANDYDAFESTPESVIMRNKVL